MAVYDRRPSGSTKGSESKRRFIERQREHLVKGLDKFLRGKSLKDVKDADEVKGKVDRDAIKINSPHSSRRKDEIVFTGNKKYSRGDEVVIPKQGSGSGGAGPGGGEDSPLSEDEFEFILSKEEFRDILFKDLKIPNFLKKSGQGEIVEEVKRAGFTKRGMPGRLHLLKTFQQAIARTLGSGKEEIELEEEDLRYRNLVVKTKPDKKAVMFCVMDVSASMAEKEKILAKKFYVLMYLFLTHRYTAVEVRFIRYHSIAREVTEDEFFLGRESGGTYTSKALALVEEIIDRDYDLSTDNIYLTLASDGGDFELDESFAAGVKIIDKLNYLAYIEIVVPNPWFDSYMDHTSLLTVFKALERTNPTEVGTAVVREAMNIPEALRTLFKRKSS
jgi:uncharacterized sporulation protein YeaH/YhbH (DUF444 family)